MKHKWTNEQRKSFARTIARRRKQKISLSAAATHENATPHKTPPDVIYIFRDETLKRFCLRNMLVYVPADE